MRLQIDTEKLKIGINESVIAGELFDLLDKFFPDKVWRKYQIVAFYDLLWNQPVIIERWNPAYPYPWWNPTIITYSTSLGTMNFPNDDLSVSVSDNLAVDYKSGFYNVEIL